MCSTPKMPTATASTKQQEVAAPTQADASVSKATASTRNKMSSLAGRDIKTAPRGLSEAALSQKKNLLGE